MGLFRNIRPATAMEQMDNYDWSGFDDNIAKNLSLANQMNTNLDNTLTEEIDINSLGVQPFNTYDRGFQTGLDEQAAAEELQANQLNQDYGQFFRNQPINQYRMRDQLSGLFRDAKQSLGQSLGQTKDEFLEDVGGLQNIIGSGVDRMQEGLGSFRNKAGQGWDFAKQLPGMAMSALTGIPGAGLLMNMLPKTSPEQRNFMENIATDPEYQDLVNSIPGMDQYNQIFGMGSGRGLTGAVGKRLATINKALGKMTPQQLAKTSLKKRKAKLEALRELERQKESEFLESQRRGRAPTAPSGGGTRDDQGDRSRGQTGGYSYDSGGRQGYGYGLKDGGLASLFTRRG